MNDHVTDTLVGDPIIVQGDIPVTPKTREERIADWRKENQAAFNQACSASCKCSPTKADMLMIEQWASPPVD